MADLGIVIHAANGKLDMSDQTKLAAAQAARCGDSDALRVLSFGRPGFLRNLRVPLAPHGNGNSFTTLLHLAAESDSVQAIYFLWHEAGCSCEIRDSNGKLPIDLAPADSKARVVLSRAQQLCQESPRLIHPGAAHS
jgi:hypothetical protein